MGMKAIQTQQINFADLMSPVQGSNPHQIKTKKKAAQHLNMHQIPVRGDPHVTLEQQNRNSRSKLNKVKNQSSTSGSNIAQMFNTSNFQG